MAVRCPAIITPNWMGWMRDLKKWLVNPLPYGCKLFALWDSCHSQTILDLDHYICNEPEDGKRMRQCRESSPRTTFWRDVIPGRKGIPQIPRSAFTTAPHELRGRPVNRASVSITAVSAGGSPPLSKWIPFSVESIQRVLSPPSWFKCNGNCPLPTEGDTKCAHVISLSACKDNQSAFDDYYIGTVTKFFIDHLSKLPSAHAVTLSSSFTQGAKPKSTLGELLLAIRQRVDKITAARQAQDAETRVISRQTTFASGSRVQLKTEWIPQAIRRNTEVNVGALEQFLQFTPSSVQEEDENEYSQQPCVSSQRVVVLGANRH
ncbi:hypothetical protein J3R83DRAFT_4968 [Lanmaoa asiatica]|nr:hypothetical protein J3R83DRAFT_4968 [Lanmaoa asiatica]